MNLFSLRSKCNISPHLMRLILTAQCLQDICVSQCCSRMLESMEGLQVSELAWLHISGRPSMVKVDQVRRVKQLWVS